MLATMARMNAAHALIDILVFRTASSDMLRLPENTDGARPSARVTNRLLLSTQAGFNCTRSKRSRGRQCEMIETIEIEKCTGCGICDIVCPADVIHMEPAP